MPQLIRAVTEKRVLPQVQEVVAGSLPPGGLTVAAVIWGCVAAVAASLITSFGALLLFKVAPK